jgi:hypothetical protein
MQSRSDTSAAIIQRQSAHLGLGNGGAQASLTLPCSLYLIPRNKTLHGARSFATSTPTYPDLHQHRLHPHQRPPPSHLSIGARALPTTFDASLRLVRYACRRAVSARQLGVVLRAAAERAAAPVIDHSALFEGAQGQQTPLSRRRRG